VRAEDVAIPVETEAGHIAQVDFGYVGELYDPDEGRLRKAYVFVLVLGYSRHMFVRLVFDQKVETWLMLHIEAFEELGGVPAVIVPDNLKAAVIRAAFASMVQRHATVATASSLATTTSRSTRRPLRAQRRRERSKPA
jgi:transposase